MKKNYLLSILSLILYFNIQNTSAQFILASDDASDPTYSSISNGLNGGSGFIPWQINVAANTAVSIGDPSTSGITSTGIGTTTWCFASTGVRFLDASRYFDSVGMEFGDELTFYWAMNEDANGGGKGFDLKKSDGTTIFNVNNYNSAVIDTDSGTISNNTGTTPMLVTLKRDNSSQYTFTMTTRSGESTYSTAISSTDVVKGVNIYTGGQNNASINRNIYFNHLHLENSGDFNITSGTETYTKNLTGSQNLSKSGTGTLTLSGENNTYSGTTTVSAGTLILNSSLSNSAVTVESGATLQISEDATLSSLTVNSGGIVIVDEGKSLDITNNLANSASSFVLNSGATMLVSGTYSGSSNVTYQRNLKANTWYLVGSPVSGVTFNDTFVTANDITSNNPNKAVASYVTLDDSWDYLQAGGTKSSTSGVGYSIQRNSTGDVSFSGTYNNSDVNTALVNTGNKFNLLGNPFAAFINLGNFHSQNTANIGTNFYLYDGSNYITKLSGTDADFEIAPGQGFFVEATTSNNVTFAISDASHQSTDTFLKSTNSRPEIILNANEGNNNRFARILYIDNKTKGYDEGYDGKLFGGASYSFSLYSDLVESDGKKYQIQSLPNRNHETMIVPIGVQADAGKKITFTAETINLSADLKVFLEDRENNIFTRLDELNSSYSITLNEKTDGIGRFYLHTNSSALNTDNVESKNISIFTKNSSTLTIVGLSEGKAKIKLFDLSGKQVLNTSFTTNNNVHDIILPQLATGVYIAQLENEQGKVSKKIILE